VWDHFTYDSIGNKSTRRHCKLMVKGKHTGNLKKHLKKHAGAMDEVRSKTEQMREATISSSSHRSTSDVSFTQLTLTQCTAKGYDKKGKHYLK